MTEKFVSDVSKIAGLCACVSLLFVAVSTPSFAADDDVGADASLLRICAAADEAPYSSRDKSGFENKIGEILAEGLGRKALFVWSSKPAIYLVRDQLDMKLCDVIMGIDTGDSRVLTSRPYYRAPYVFIQRKDSPLKIENWNSPDLAKAAKIGFAGGTPADIMLTKLDLWTKHISYSRSLTNFQDKRNRFTRIPPSRMIGEVADGTADLAVGFGPEVARYVKSNDNLKMIVIPDDNTRADGEKVPHHFDQSVAVRKGDTDLLAAIDATLEKVKPKIEAVLKDEGVPFVLASPRM
jgi:mxaJ protein